MPVTIEHLQSKAIQHSEHTPFKPPHFKSISSLHTSNAAGDNPTDRSVTLPCDSSHQQELPAAHPRHTAQSPQLPKVCAVTSHPTHVPKPKSRNASTMTTSVANKPKMISVATDVPKTDTVSAAAAALKAAAITQMRMRADTYAQGPLEACLAKLKPPLRSSRTQRLLHGLQRTQVASCIISCLLKWHGLLGFALGAFDGILLYICGYITWMGLYDFIWAAHGLHNNQTQLPPSADNQTITNGSSCLHQWATSLTDCLSMEMDGVWFILVVLMFLCLLPGTHSKERTP